jgi:hypothetical protein
MRLTSRLAIASLLVGAPAAFAFSGFQGVTLHWLPKEGEVMNYQVVASLQIEGQTAEMRSKLAVDVIKVDSDGAYAVQMTGSDGTIAFAGQQFPAPRSMTITHYKPNGDVIDMTGEQVVPQSFRMANLSNMRWPDKPVNVGDAWTVDIKAGDKAPFPVKGSFKLDSEEKIGTIDTYKIVGSLKEVEGSTPGEIDSTYWLSKADFSIVKNVAKWVGVSPPGAKAPLNGLMTMTRVEAPAPATGPTGTTGGG